MRKIIFDLDDTLYADKELRGKREKAILDFLKDKADSFLKIKEKNTTLESLRLLGVTKEKFYEIVKNVPIKLEKDNSLIELFKELRKRFKLIILSNNSYFCIEETLKQLGIIELIDEYYGGESFISAKPAEENFFLVNKDDICVGNNFKKDLEIPKKRGAITVLVSDKYNPEADFNIKNIHMLKEAIRHI